MIQDTKTALRLTRIVNADPRTAFDAWTQPEQIRHWACPEGHSIVDSQVDLAVGGRYLLKMKNEQGAAHTAVGVYRQVDPPHRLVYTWDWEEEDHKVGETVVTVEFHQHGQGTEIVLTHEAFPAGEATQAHLEGWSSCLDKFERRFHAAGAQEPAAAIGSDL